MNIYKAKYRMITFICLIVPISRIFSLVFDYEDGASSFLKTSNSCFLRPKTIKLDVLRKNPQARFPAGLGSACLIEASYDSFHVSDRPDLSDLFLGF